MELLLGAHCYDVTHRALVLGIVVGEGMGLDPLLRSADALVAAGADALEVSGDEVVPAVTALRARFNVPLCVRTDRASVAAAAFAEGAVVGHDRSGLADAGYLDACAAAGASVVTTAPCAPRAVAGGLVAEAVLIDAEIDGAPTEAEALARLRALDAVVALGHPVVVAVPFGPDAAMAAHALGVALGARLLRAHDVRSARRVADTMAAILEAAA